MIDVIKATPVSLGYLTLGGFVVLYSMVSLLVKEKLYMGEVVLGTGFGVIIGPYCAKIFDPRSWGSGIDQQNKVTLEVMRIVLATGLFAMGVELPMAYVAKHARSLLMMVVPTMAFGWLVSAGIIHGLFPTLTIVSSLVISACLTPTDPVLAAAIIGGNYATKNVSAHIRHLLCAESAANDGLAYPFLSISIYLAVESSKRVAFGKWFLIGWLYQVILGTVLGALLGLAFSFLMKTAHRRGIMDRESFVAQYLAFAIFIIGIVSTIGSDDLLAAFAAGTAISWDGHFKKNTKDEHFSSIIDLVLNCACFIYIGAWIPFNTFNASSLGLEPWRLIVLFLAILVLRRIPSLLLLYKFVPDIHSWREALFCGHFGPMGVGAIFISTLALTELPEPNDPPASQNELLAATIHPIVSFVVLGSILIHSLSIPAFWFGRKSYARTISLTYTLTRTWTSHRGDAQPDWVAWARRVPTSTSPDNRESSVLAGDLERGASLSRTATPLPKNDEAAENEGEGSISSSKGSDLSAPGETLRGRPGNSTTNLPAGINTDGKEVIIVRPAPLSTVLNDEKSLPQESIEDGSPEMELVTNVCSRHINADIQDLEVAGRDFSQGQDVIPVVKRVQVAQ